MFITKLNIGIEQSAYYIIHYTISLSWFPYFNQPLRTTFSLNIFKDIFENAKPNDSDNGAHSRFYVKTVH